MKEGHGFCALKVTTFPGIQKKIITMNLNSPSHHLLFRMNSHQGLCPKTNYYKSDGNVVCGLSTSYSYSTPWTLKVLIIFER
jgi:hypothetical protein